MLTRDRFIPSLSTVLIAGLVAFQSCSHQSRYEELEDTFSAMVTEEESSSSQETATVAKEEQSQAENFNNNQEPQTVVAASENKVEETAPEQTATVSNETHPLVEFQDTGAKLDLAEESNRIEQPSGSYSMETSSPPSAAPMPMSTPVTPQRTVYKTPRIPGKALKRKEGILNRFYFVRSGDTPESVSTLIYGSPEKAHQFWVSKGMKWAPGRLIYYSSPKNPGDSRMLSFYKEEGISGARVKVKRGNWLSKIAKQYLGSPKSWVEIAVMNQINDPFDLKVGQKLVLFPDIRPKTNDSVALANNQTATTQPAPEAATPPPQVLAQATPPILNPESPSQPQSETSPISPPSATEDVQPRAPLAVEEEPSQKKLSARDYVRALIQKLTQMLRRKQ